MELPNTLGLGGLISVAIFRPIVFDRKLSDSAFRMYCVLVANASNNWRFYRMGLAKILGGKSKRQVARYIQELKVAHLLVIDRAHDPVTKRWIGYQWTVYPAPISVCQKAGALPLCSKFSGVEA
jgi:hypothetical protein